MGNSFCHIELSTSDLGKAKRFYGDLFDWKLSAAPIPGMDYTMLDAGKGKVGGGMQGLQMPGQPTSWLAYVEVADVEKTLAKVAKGGGKVVLPRMEIGAGMGAIGVFSDPQGAYLGVWEKGKKQAAPKKAAKKSDAKKSDAKKSDGKKAAKKAAPKKK